MVGGGAFGLSVALACAWRGAAVILHRGEVGWTSASAVAAGMLAPDFEAAADGPSPDAYRRLLSARDRWPAFLEYLAAPPRALDRAGAVWVDADGRQADAVQARLAALGAPSVRIGAAELRGLHPRLGPAMTEGVFTEDDWRIEPRAVLPIMAQALGRAGGRLDAGRVGPREALEGVDAVVLAMGADTAGWLDTTPVLATLTPIKGQILHFSGGPATGPTLRSAGGYAVPQPGGTVFGATMEPGVADLALDPARLGELRRHAAAVLPHLAGAPAEGMAGVRASTPDGQPLIGEVEAPPHRPRLLLATGARRNGWLLAPLAGELIAERLGGDPADPAARAFDPRRFDTPPRRR